MRFCSWQQLFYYRLTENCSFVLFLVWLLTALTKALKINCYVIVSSSSHLFFVVVVARSLPRSLPFPLVISVYLHFCLIQHAACLNRSDSIDVSALASLCVGSFISEINCEFNFYWNRKLHFCEFFARNTPRRTQFFAFPSRSCSNEHFHLLKFIY